MIYFDSGMSKSTNTVVCFDWKTVIYIYVCGKFRAQFMLPMEFEFEFLVFYAILSNISAISWRQVLVVEEAGVPGDNHRPWASNW